MLFINNKIKIKFVSSILDNNKIGELLPGHFTDLNNLNSLRASKNRITVADFSDLEGSTALTFM